MAWSHTLAYLFSGSFVVGHIYSMLQTNHIQSVSEKYCPLNRSRVFETLSIYNKSKSFKGILKQVYLYYSTQHTFDGHFLTHLLLIKLCSN